MAINDFSIGMKLKDYTSKVTEPVQKKSLDKYT